MSSTTIPGFTVELAHDVAEGAAADITTLLRSAQHLTMSEWGARLEDEFAAMAGVRHAVAVATGTAALEIALRAANVTGRDVIVPTNTFGATPVAVLRAGGKPVLCDSAEGSLTPGPEQVERAITPDTAAVIIVHIGGHLSREVDAIDEVCARRRIALVEDAAHAVGSSAGGRGPGARGVGAAYSFFNTKVLSAGEGGMLATNSDDVAASARLLRDHAKDSKGAMATTGGSWRLPELTAVLAHHQLAALPRTIAGRARVATLYEELLSRCEVPVVRPAAGTTSNWYKLIVPTGSLSADAVEAGLARRGVQPAGRVYAVPCHRQGAFAAMASSPLPVADRHADGHVCLPIHSAMGEDEVTRVVSAFLEVLADGVA